MLWDNRIIQINIDLENRTVNFTLNDSIEVWDAREFDADTPTGMALRMIMSAILTANDYLVGYDD